MKKKQITNVGLKKLYKLLDSFVDKLLVEQNKEAVNTCVKVMTWVKEDVFEDALNEALKPEKPTEVWCATCKRVMPLPHDLQHREEAAS